jgi:hypothetical protein
MNFLYSFLIITACSTVSKINFDLTMISPSGLTGKPDGLRSLTYEFCIPADSEAIKEVQSIDPSLKIYPHSPGRIGCKKGEYLCIGDTHQVQWKEILLKLANLTYIQKINPFYGE